MSAIAVRIDRGRKTIMVDGSFPFLGIDAMNVYCDDASNIGYVPVSLSGCREECHAKELLKLALAMALHDTGVNEFDVVFERIYVCDC